VASAVVEVLAPIQARYAELSSDPETMAKVLDDGADRARAIAAPTLRAAQRNAGLLPRRGEGSASDEPHSA
jgi:tryptophanyl-tRNA synthetase